MSVPLWKSEFEMPARANAQLSILRLRPTPVLCFLPMNWKGSGIAGAGFRRLLSTSRAGQWNKRMAWLPLR